MFEDSADEQAVLKSARQAPVKGSVPHTPRSTRTSRNARALKEEIEQLEQAIARSLVDLRGHPPSMGKVGDGER